MEKMYQNQILFANKRSFLSFKQMFTIMVEPEMITENDHIENVSFFVCPNN